MAEDLKLAQEYRIAGYRGLTDEEISWMNIVFEEGGRIKELIDTMAKLDIVDKYWLNQAIIDFRVGLMKLGRSIGKPTFF